MKLDSNKFNEIVGGFFSFGERVVACVSGGADSMALLLSLINCKKKLQIVVAHFNHGLRGAESDGDEELVRAFCKKKELEFFCKKVNVAQVAKEKKLSLELAGRKERYSFFYEFDRTIVTAHTLSDRVETMLFNLARGASLKGLCSIPSVRSKIKRPLLCFSRADIEAYCTENELQFRIDSSNFSLAYSRNRVRHKIVPEFRKLNGNFEFNVGRTIFCLQNDEDYFSEVVSEIFKKRFIKGKLNVLGLENEHWAIKSRVVIEFFKISEVEISHKLVEQVLNLIKKRCFKINIPRRKVLSLYDNFLSVGLAKENRFCKFDFVLPEFVEFSHKNLLLIKTKVGHFNYFLSKMPYLFLFKFDYDKINGLIHLRNRLSGDKIKLPRRPTKKIKSLMQETRLPAEKRDEVVVLADDLGPFWVCGVGGDARVLADEGTENLILIFQKKKEC